MKCYICNQTVEHSCRGSVPNTLNSSDHLKDHPLNSKINDTFAILEDVDKLTLFNKITDQLRKFINEIILNTNNQLNHLKKETKNSLFFFNRIVQSLNKKYLEGRLDKLLLKETMTLILYDIDLQRFEHFMRNYNDPKNIKAIMHANNYIYIGEYENKQKNGRGIIKYLAEGPSKGDIYEGEFKNNLIEGKGIYKYLSEGPNKGNIYEGEFKNNAKDGRGVYM